MKKKTLNSLVNAEIERENNVMGFVDVGTATDFIIKVHDWSDVSSEYLLKTYTKTRVRTSLHRKGAKHYAVGDGIYVRTDKLTQDQLHSVVLRLIQIGKSTKETLKMLHALEKTAPEHPQCAFDHECNTYYEVGKADVRRLIEVYKRTVASMGESV